MSFRERLTSVIPAELIHIREVPTNFLQMRQKYWPKAVALTFGTLVVEST